VPLQTFNFANPSDNLRSRESPRLKKAQFGDGYSARAAKGINSINREWDLTFDVDPDVGETILNFLRDHKGAIPFRWTPYGEPETAVVCESWEHSKYQSYTLISCTFVKDFVPL